MDRQVVKKDGTLDLQVINKENVDEVQTEFGGTILHYACRELLTDDIDYLVTKCLANVNLTNDYDENAFELLWPKCGIRDDDHTRQALRAR